VAQNSGKADRDGRKAAQRPDGRDADRATFDASMTLSLTLPGDVVLYLLLPIYAESFGVSLPEVGILLAANRLVRILGYGWVARLYGNRGPRLACTLASVGSVLATAGYFLFSGLWALLAARLVWGLSFAAMNIAVHALPTSEIAGAARRSGWSRSIVACGSMLALAAGGVGAHFFGPRIVFAVLATVALVSLPFALRLPKTPERHVAGRPKLTVPGPISIWSFCMGISLDGLFTVGLALLAREQLPEGAAIAAGLVMATRYLFERTLAPVGGRLAERVGARRLLVIVSLIASAAFVLLALDSPLIWIGALFVIAMRALLQPLPAPVVAEAFPGAARVAALARQATWRDIGAGAGPLVAGLLFPVLPALAIYGSVAALLAGSSIWLAKRRN
jgi:MFS family permease